MPGHSSVVVTRMTTTTTSTSAIYINIGYLKGLPGILKLLQLIIGIVCVGIVAYYYDRVCNYQLRAHRHFTVEVDLYFLLVAVACMITTFILLLSCLISFATASMLPKTIFENMYHFVAFLLYLTAGIAYLAAIIKRSADYYKEEGYDAKMAAAGLGLVLAALYFIHAVIGYRVYRVG